MAHLPLRRGSRRRLDYNTLTYLSRRRMKRRIGYVSSRVSRQYAKAVEAIWPTFYSATSIEIGQPIARKDGLILRTSRFDQASDPPDHLIQSPTDCEHLARVTHGCPFADGDHDHHS